MKKRIVSLLLAVIMLFSTVPVTAFADTETETQTAEAVLSLPELWSATGSTFEMDVTLTGNPGILGAVITLSWDEGLTLVEASSGEAFKDLMYQGPGRFSNSGTNFVWYGSELTTVTDGTVLTLTFQVSEDAKELDQYSVQVSCKSSDIYDQDYNPVNVSTVNGSLLVINYTPGDVNDNGHITVQDLILLSQYISDGCTTDPESYNVTVNEKAADVDDSGSINPRDLILISQYISDDCQTVPDGYNVTLKPSIPKCEHEAMEATAEKAAACTDAGNIAYWYCPDCGKYFSDENATAEITQEDTVITALGHNSVSVDAVPSTPTTEGYTAGVWCDRCETWLHGHEVIPPIELDEGNISYRHYVKVEKTTGVEIVYDDYLSTHEIINPNPITYKEGIGVEELIEAAEIDGKRVSANGYSFLGWYERPEVTANRVYSISSEETGNKILYGIWSKDVYTITYVPADSYTVKLPHVEDGSYTIDKETSLKTPPSWPNMVWVGWSNENGEIVKSIPKGTTGNITLTANWMSRRNQTVPNVDYADSLPAVAVDEENGIYAFTYEIGDIQNVPIQQVEDGVDGKGFNLVQGATHEIDKEFYQEITQEEATSVANIIANATTKSDSWTLSEDWNKSTSFSQEHSSEVTEEQTLKATKAFEKSGQYTLSAGMGGTEEHIDESGNSTKVTKTNEFGVGINIGKESTLGANLGAKGEYMGVEISGGISGSETQTQGLSLDYKHTTENENSHYESHTDKTSSHWDVNEGFEISGKLSGTKEFANSVSQSIKDTYQYGETLDFGGSQSNTVSSSNTSSNSREYASSVSYSTLTGSKVTVKETLTADAEEGFYRKVLAANFKVFAVVIYDMKSNTFSVMTHSLKINNSEHLFTDYSTVSSFDDYENGVLPFEVPAFVGDYVYALRGMSEGLKIDENTGIVTQYGYTDPASGICYKKYDPLTGVYSDPCDTDVIIPRYDVQNGVIIPITGIADGVFKGTNITSVYLSSGITELPEGVFADCTSLKYVRGGAIESIGKDAFKNCTSLYELTLPYTITNLGENAFENVKALTVNVANTAVFHAALQSGVTNLSLDLSNFEGTLDGTKIVTPTNMEFLSINGGGKTFKNISIVSDADTVVLNNIIIQNSSEVPLVLSSNNVEFAFTTISSSGLIMRLDAERTNVTLEGNNYLTSSGENAVLSKSVVFAQKEGSSSADLMHVTGNVLVYGDAYGTQYVQFENPDEHSIRYLTQEEYDNMLNSHYVYFDANEGIVDVEKKLVMWNTAIGELPTPTRDYYTFLGWFTEPDGGTEVTSTWEMTALEDVTVYAQWELNALSDWVMASEVPEDAQIENQKWSYTLTTNTESKETSLDGYTQVGSYWVESGRGSKNYSPYFPSTFDTSHWIYTSFAKSAPSGYETATTKRVVTNNWAGFVYWHWMYSVSYANSTNRTISDRSGQYDASGNSGTGNNYTKFYALLSAADCTYLDNLYCCSRSQPSYYCHDILPSDKTGIGTPRFFRFSYYVSDYVDYYKMFQYQKVEQLESETQIEASDTVSNVQEWVQYRAK